VARANARTTPYARELIVARLLAGHRPARRAWVRTGLVLGTVHDRKGTHVATVTPEALIRARRPEAGAAS
jgi:hypothetical protein